MCNLVHLDQLGVLVAPVLMLVVFQKNFFILQLKVMIKVGLLKTLVGRLKNKVKTSMTGKRLEVMFKTTSRV